MRVKHYQDSAQFIKKGWVHYPIQRERMLRRAAQLMGWPSYQMYLHKNNKAEYFKLIKSVPRSYNYEFY